MMGLPSLNTLDRAQTVRIWLATETTDTRWGLDRSAERVKAVMQEEPLSGHLFVFRSRREDRLKILVWDGEGFVLWYKRLETVVFKLSQVGEGARSLQLRASDLAKFENLPVLQVTTHVYELKPESGCARAVGTCGEIGQPPHL